MSPQVIFSAHILLPNSMQEVFEVILQKMFPVYQRIIVENELAEGRSGCWVFVVSLLRDTETRDLPVVAKIGSISLIKKEWHAYKSYIEGKWPQIAEVRHEPVVDNNAAYGGLYYSLVGEGVFPTQSIRRFCLEAPIDHVQMVIERLLKIVEQKFRYSKKRAGYQLHASYDRIFPVNLLIAPASSSIETEPILITPQTIFASPIETDTYVRVSQFIVTKVDLKKKAITLNLPQMDEDDLPSTSYIIRFTFESHATMPIYKVGQPLPGAIIGRVIQTRTSQWQIEMKKILPDGNFSLADKTVLLPDGTTLPNPFVKLPEILSQHRDIKADDIHGDLNVENILVDPDVRDVRLIDFAGARSDHVLHDFLRFETEIVVRLIAPIMAEAKLSAQSIYTFYQHLHWATFQPTPHGTSYNLPHIFDKPLMILVLVRQAARELALFNRFEYEEYYQCLILYLLGALKFKVLDDVPEAPYPKQVAFWGAASITAILSSKVNDSKESPGFAPSFRQRQDWSLDQIKAKDDYHSRSLGQFEPSQLKTWGNASITVGDISGSGNAIGHGAQVTTTTTKREQNAIFQIFETVYRQINIQTRRSNGSRAEIINIVQLIEQEVIRGEQANSYKLNRWFNDLNAMAPDIAKSIASSLTDPTAEVPPTIRQIAAQVGG
ncbi:MAG: hypothetical protein KDJ65_14770 [Anaerolineae bacterium]|nr:hypothetical protein [Anaerolineae bacterium]